MTDAAHTSPTCPECGGGRDRPPVTRRPGWWGFWPVGVAVLLVWVLGWRAGADQLPRASASSRYQALGDGITLGDLRRMSRGESPAGRLGQALSRPWLEYGVPPEWSMVSVGTMAGPHDPLGGFRRVSLGWPGPWIQGTSYDEPGTQARLPITGGWGFSVFSTGFTLSWEDVGGTRGWYIVLDGLTLACDLVGPAILIAAARRVLPGRRRLMVTSGALALGLLWVGYQREALCTGITSMSPLGVSLSTMREGARTAEGARALAGAMLSVVPVSPEDDLVALQIGSPSSDPALRLTGPGGDRLLDVIQYGGDGLDPRPSWRCWPDAWGLQVASTGGPSEHVQWTLAWQGVGFLAGVPAALWLGWAAVTGVRAWREGRRAARGLCRSCGYDLRGLVRPEGPA